MSTVLPIEPAIRRRDAALPAVPFERDVAIPVHQHADARITGRVTTTVPALSERELATRFFPLAAVVAAVDLATKAWAVASLSAHSAALGSSVSLSLAFNRGAAGGVSLGANTRSINFMLTGLVVGLVVMIAPALTRHDRRAWRALALITGAGLGNMISLATSERGVPDFIALHRSTGGAVVLNLADIALVAGLVLLARTVIGLIRMAEPGARRLALR